MVQENKLRRYSSKDYSEVIDFPVELIDRDGVVRRYSFEESLRVYQRRIASAQWRYSDDSVIAAEVDHCKKRIDQIRRSYLLRCKDIGARVAREQQTGDQTILGEGLALLHETLTREQGGPLRTEELPIEIEVVVERGVPAVYQIRRSDHDGAYLLYIFPKEHEDDFVAHVHTLQPASAFDGGRFERLLQARRGETANFVLTGRPAASDGAAGGLAFGPVDGGLGDIDAGLFEPDEALPWWSAPEDPEDPSPGATELSTGLSALRRKDLNEAIRQFKAAIEVNPYHRDAYLALSTLLDATGAVEEGEMYGTMAMSYLPDDGMIRFNVGLNLLRQGRHDEALAAFEQAGRREPELHQPRYFAGLILAVGGRLDEAAAALTAARAREPEEERIETALGWVQRRIRIRRSTRIVGALALMAAGALVFVSPWLAAGGGLVAAGLFAVHPVGRLTSRRRLAKLADYRPVELPAIEPRGAGTDQTS